MKLRYYKTIYVEADVKDRAEYDAKLTSFEVTLQKVAEEIAQKLDLTVDFDVDWEESC